MQTWCSTLVTCTSCFTAVVVLPVKKLMTLAPLPTIKKKEGEEVGLGL
jgi:hypothetical protein